MKIGITMRTARSTEMAEVVLNARGLKESDRKKDGDVEKERPEPEQMEPETAKQGGKAARQQGGKATRRQGGKAARNAEAMEPKEAVEAVSLECARARAQSGATAGQQPAACVQLRSLHLCSETDRWTGRQTHAAPCARRESRASLAARRRSQS